MRLVRPAGTGPDLPASRGRALLLALLGQPILEPVGHGEPLGQIDSRLKPAAHLLDLRRQPAPRHRADQTENLALRQATLSRAVEQRPDAGQGCLRSGPRAVAAEPER